MRSVHCQGFQHPAWPTLQEAHRSGVVGIMSGYIRAERVLMRAHADYSEAWVQQLIAEDPSVLGLGELVLRDRERIHPRAGRLDLLLQDVETKRRYEVELQLGATDEAHIVRTIEYWDIERKRYPQYEHCAVIIAEDITSRFLNVISLFNGSIPLIAIQMQALKVGEHVTLAFTTVVDELVRGFVDEDEDAQAAPADRAYWEAKAAKETVALADEVLALARETDPSLEPKYNQFYIGMTRQRQAFNAITCRPRRNHLILGIRLPEADEITSRIEALGVEIYPYDRRDGAYRLRLTRKDLAAAQTELSALIHLAIEERA